MTPPAERGGTCPSGRCREGATLLGIVGPDGRLGHLDPPIPVDAGFAAKARKGRDPESRFRFAEPCGRSGCAQWDEDHCGLIEEILVAREPQPPTGLVRCGIRPSCQWFAQRGAAACEVCPLVVRVRRVPAAGQPIEKFSAEEGQR